MDDRKTKPINPKYSVSKEIHKAAHAEAMAQEEYDKAYYKLVLAGCEIKDAVNILDAGCDPKQALEMVKQGQTTESIIETLKKNDADIGYTPP